MKEKRTTRRQAGSFRRLHPFESSDSHLPCNGQNVSLKMGILSQTLFVLFCHFSMAPSKGFRILPCNHVHVLSETGNELKQVT